MKTLRDMASLTVDSVRYEGGVVVAQFTLRATKIMRPKDAEAATVAIINRFRDLLIANGITSYAWPPDVEIDPHSDFIGMQGRVVTMASQPAVMPR